LSPRQYFNHSEVPIPVDSEVEHMLEQRQFAIDGRSPVLSNWYVHRNGDLSQMAE